MKDLKSLMAEVIRESIDREAMAEGRVNRTNHISESEIDLKPLKDEYVKKLNELSAVVSKIDEKSPDKGLVAKVKSIHAEFQKSEFALQRAAKSNAGK
jgi:hypothetical protein